MSYASFIVDLKKTLEKMTGVPHTILFTENRKNNGIVLRSICIKKSNSNLAPSIGLDYFYNEYVSGRSIDEIAEKINDIYLSQPEYPDNQLVLQWEGIKNCVVYCLVNSETNQAFIQKCPGIPLSDMTLLFQIKTDYFGVGGNVTITYRMLEMLHIDFKTLVTAALKNTPVLLPLLFKKTNDLQPESDRDTTYNDAFSSYPSSSSWIVGNTERSFGAAAVLYDDFPKAFEKNGWTDAYLLPMSVHEMLALDCNDDIKVSKLKKAVAEINSLPDCVRADDLLSDSVYRYSALRKDFEEALAALDISR